MLRYRAASAFGRFHIPDLILGIQSVEENEVIEAEVTVAPEPAESKLDKVSEILAPKTEPQPVPPAPKTDLSQLQQRSMTSLTNGQHTVPRHLSAGRALGHAPSNAC